MNEQELREKIIKVLTERIGIFEGLADALVAAKIGGVSELKKHRMMITKDGTIKQLYSGKEVEQIVKERDEYKHRAEVAERALSNACRNIIADEKDGIEIEPRDEVLYKAYLKQAEKELQEERQDD